MRAAQIASHDGPIGVRVVDLPEPADGAETFISIAGFGAEVRIDVRAAGVSFPELLQSRGEYQNQPPLPFVPGGEVAGLVISAPAGSGFGPGDRVFAFCEFGGFAEVALAPVGLTFPLADELSFAEGAGLFGNYHTAYFALVTRGRARAGETVVVHGAAGGVGTATLQVAAALGLTTIAVVSGAEKAEVARRASADHVVRSDRSWKDEVLELCGGADLVIDTVGDRTLDSLRSLREEGRLVIVGFAAGEIPEVKANRLLLRNLEVVGAGYGAYAFSKPAFVAEIAAKLEPLIASGLIRPLVDERFELAQAADALARLEGRRATGKVVLRIDPSR